MYKELLKTCDEYNATLVAVSKTKPIDQILPIYEEGQRDFGENRVQELVDKYEKMPKDIRWHQIGHLQKNKVKYIAPFIHLIHSIDSIELLQVVNTQAIKYSRYIKVLLQVKIAEEDSKFGLSELQSEEILNQYNSGNFRNVEIVGLMGMATFTDNQEHVQAEFRRLIEYKKKWTEKFQISLNKVSMGMSGDYQLALTEGSTMIRVGSLIFGIRR